MDNNFPITEEYVEAAQSETDKKRYEYRDSLGEKDREDFNKIERIVEQLNDTGRTYLLLSSPEEADKLFIRYFNFSKGKGVLQGKEREEYLSRSYFAFVAAASLFLEIEQGHFNVVIESKDKKLRRVITTTGIIDE